MKKYTKKVRLATILAVVVALIFSSMTVSYAASKTKTMTVYTEVVKKGNYAYCAARNGIHRVNLKTGARKRIVKFNKDSPAGGPSCMKLHKGYLYYELDGMMTQGLYRIKLNGTGRKYLAEIWDYTISKGKIYYTTYNYKNDKAAKRVMSLNGKNKKKSSYNVKQRYKSTNATGYRVKTELKKTEKEYFNEESCEVIEHYTEYLTTPNGEKIKLCSYTYSYLEEW